MCLSIPSKVVEIHREDASVTVDTMGVERRVSTYLMTESLEIGDFVLIHVGFIMNKIDEKSAEESLTIYREIAEKLSDEENCLQ